jgi:hypothetical protein
MALARTKLTPLPCAWNSPTKAKGAQNNVMGPNNIYLDFIVYYRLARRGQKQQAVPEPEFKPFDLLTSRVRPRGAINRKTEPEPRIATQDI